MDEIQRKLALIDNELAGRTLRGRLVGAAPLFLPAVGLMTGILLQEKLAGGLPSALPWTWLAAAIPAGTVVFAAGIRSRLSPTGFAFIASFCFLCLGAIRLLAFETPAPSDIRHYVGPERVLATIRGRILTQPYQQPQTWCFAQFASADPPTAFYLRMEALETPDGRVPVEGTIRVRVDEPAPNLNIGDRVQAYCWLHRYEEPTNPGQFDVAEYLRLRNVYVGASVPAREAITVFDGPRGILTNLRRTFTAAATGGLLDHPPSDTQGEAILEALLLGERRNIDPDTYEAFRRTGLLHLVSLSGMHMCILIAVVWRFGRFVGLMKPARAAVCAVATIVLLLIVPLQAPILRAAVIVWALCASLLLRRRSNPLNSLSLAAIILLVIQPTQLFDVGWQLSFAATAGILAFTGRIENWLRTGTRGRLEPSGSEAMTVTGALKALANGTIRVLSVGVAAWLGSAGILLYHFYNVTPPASVWTAIAALPVTAILTIGFLKIVLSFFLPTASVFLGYLLSMLADLLIWMVRLMEQIDPSYILIGHVPLVLILLYYVLILVSAFLHLRRPIVKRVLCTAMLLTLLIPLGVMKWQRTHRDHLSIACLDVGHGQAILARLPGTQNILFDAGSLYGSDVGTRIILPFLDYEGISRLHAVVVSHRDIDHINGLPEVANRRRIDRVCFDDASFTQSQDVETIQVLMKHLENRQIRAERMPATIDAGRARIRMVWPTGESAVREQLSDNDKSLVCRIECAGQSVLLCSDIETLAQREIMGLYPALQADVIVVPHHGSVRTLDSRFIERLAPGILVCSCGSRDWEQNRVMKAPASGRLLITARDGAINVCIDRLGVIQTMAWTQQY